MRPFLNKLFKLKSNKVSVESKELFESIKDISQLSNEISKQQRVLYNKEYDLLLKNKNEVFISLMDFLDLMEIENLTIKDIVLKCKHSSEIGSLQTSSVTLHSIIEDDHIILCRDIENCEKHKDQIAQKIKITTIKLVD